MAKPATTALGGVELVPPCVGPYFEQPQKANGGRLLAWLARQPDGRIEHSAASSGRPGGKLATTGGISPGWVIAEAGLDCKEGAMGGLVLGLEEAGLLLREGNLRRTKAIQLDPDLIEPLQAWWEEAQLDARTGAGALSEGERAALRGGPQPAPQPEPEPRHEEAPATEPAAHGPDELAPPDGDLDYGRLGAEVLSQALEAIAAGRKADGDSSVLAELQGRVAELLAANNRMRIKVRELQDHVGAVTQQRDHAIAERRQAQDSLDRMAQLIARQPPPPDERARKELDRMIREIPVLSRRGAA